MSRRGAVVFELAVWDADPPANHALAGRQFTALHERYIAAGSSEPPTLRLELLVRALLERYPDDLPEEEAVWAVGPLAGIPVGLIMHWAVMWERSEEATAAVVSLVRLLGLVVYAPRGRGRAHPHGRHPR